MDSLKVFVDRLKKIGVELELTGNFPWVYLTKVNGNPVYEKFMAKHGFTIAFIPIKEGQKLEFTDIGKIFKLIRQYLGPQPIRRAEYDKSTKSFEVLRITYTWDKYKRELLYGDNNWKHYRYYNTMEGALDAVKNFRNNNSYWDYPAMSTGVQNEIKYPHIRPTITIYRYKAVLRDDINLIK